MSRFFVYVFGWLFMASMALADIPEDYYADAMGKDGNALKSALHTIIDGHKVIPYTQKGNINWFDGNDMDVWEALVYTDSACPDAEPSCGLVQLLYLDETRHVSQANRGKGGNDVWDREHVWPKSRGFPRKSQDGYTDLHHLRPADRNINATHSNYGYDTGGTIVYDKLKDGTQVATEARIDRKKESFEPPDRAKGQVARMLFYMAIRYGPDDQAKPEYMPDLYLKDENKRVKDAWIGDLCTLLDWHEQFPPTAFEKRRNNRVMQLQGNRNPFIDKPEFAYLIWKRACQG